MQAAVRLRAQECLEESIISSIHAMTPASAKQALDAWRYLVDSRPVQQVEGGQLVNKIGDWKVLDSEQSKQFFADKG